MQPDSQNLRNTILSLKCLHASSSERKRCWLAAPCLILTAMMGTAWNAGQAQTAHFSGVQGTIPSSTLNYAYSVAVDGSGNVYIANSGLSQVLKETLSNGNYTESNIGSGLYFPGSIAVDGIGNVYIADTDNNRVLKETLSGNSYSQTTIAGGLSVPYGVAVDGSGNVYIADSGNDRVLKETLNGGSYSQTNIISGSAYTEIAVDESGNIYLSDPNNKQVLRETLSGGGYTQSTITTNVDNPAGIAVDRSGIVYIADVDTAAIGRVLKETPSSGNYTQSVVYSGAIGPYGIAIDSHQTLYVTNIYTTKLVTVQMSGAQFGSVNVASPSAAMSLIFAFDSAGSIGKPAVLTQGAPNLDFSDAGTGSCTTNGTSHEYNAGDFCYIDVILTPTTAGSRYGAAVLKDNSGNVLATGYVQGTGVGPLVNFLPGTQSVLAKGTFTPIGIAVDAVGNIYFADSGGSQLLKGTLSGGSYTLSTVASGLNGIWQVAVDGSGSVYIAQWDNGGSAGQVFKETPSSAGYVQSNVGSGFVSPWGVSVDGTGNVYIADGYYGAVYKEALTAGTYTQSTIVSGLGDAPLQIAVDASGNVYVADVNEDSVLKETPSSGSYTSSTIGSGLNSPYGIAIDSSGDVYIADTGNNRVLKEVPSGSTYIQSTLAGGLNNPDGVAVDGSGNVYISDSFNHQILEEDFYGPPALTFDTTTYGATSADSPQTVTLENAGNAALIFPVPSSGDNPSIAANFSLNSGEELACPHVAAGSSTAGTLAAGASCQLAVSFVPAAAGSLSGSLLLTDNHLNSASPGYATQRIALIGSATKALSTIVLVGSPNAAFVSNPVTFTATLSSQAGTPTGSVSFYDASTLLGVGALTAGVAAYTTSGLAAGSHSITASYSGDGNFLSGSISPLTETIEDFTFGASGGGTIPSQTVSRGGQAAYTLAVAPPSGTVLAGPITFTVTGLPPGVSAAFSPATVSLGSAATNVTMTVAVPKQSAALRLERPFSGAALPLAMALILLPCAGQLRRSSRHFSQMVCVLSIGMGCTVLVAGLAGCGGSGSSGGNSSSQPQSYTLTITATSGSLSHTVTAGLTVE